MTPEMIAAGVAMLTAIGSTLYLLFQMSTKYAKLELKVDTMWEFLMRRGKAEAVRSGMAQLNSPIVFNAESMTWMDPFKPELQRFYAAFLKENPKPTDMQLSFEIEKTFGDRILKEICIPKGIMLGACLQLAIAVAKNEASRS